MQVAGEHYLVIMEEDEHIEHVRHGELLEDEPVEGWAFAIAAEAEQELQAALGEALTIAGGPRAGSRKSSSAHSSTGGGTAYGSTAGGGPDNAAAAQPQHHHHAQSFGSVPEYAEVDVETEQQKYEARIKKGVQKDIKWVLVHGSLLEGQAHALPFPLAIAQDSMTPRLPASAGMSGPSWKDPPRTTHSKGSACINPAVCYFRRMLMSTKAYVQYHVAPPSISKDKVKVRSSGVTCGGA